MAPTCGPERGEGVSEEWLAGGSGGERGRGKGGVRLLCADRWGTPVRGRARTRAEREGAGSGARTLLSGPALSEGGGEARSAETLG